MSENAPQVERVITIRYDVVRWGKEAQQQIDRKHDGYTISQLAARAQERETIAKDLRSRLCAFVDVEDGLRVRRAARAQAAMHFTLGMGVGLVLLLAPALAVATGREMRRLRQTYHEALEAQGRAARSLRESEEKLRLANDAARMGAWNWNMLTGELVWSDRCKALFGLSPDTA